MRSEASRNTAALLTQPTSPAVALGDVRGSRRVGLGAGVAWYPGDARMLTCPGQSLFWSAIDRDPLTCPASLRRSP